jgi:hypothetical protein
MTVARWILVLVAVFVTGVAVGMLCAPPTESNKHFLGGSHERENKKGQD